MNQWPPPPDDGYPPPPPPPASGRPASVTLRSPDRRPIATYVILGLTVFVFVLQLLSQAVLGGDDLPAVLGAKINALIYRGQYWRLLTPALLHGSIMHIAFNMYALVALGSGLERQYGSGRFLALYLVGALGGNVLSMVFSPNPSLGASTAVFGLLGAQAVLVLQNRHMFGERYGPIIANTLGIAAINLLIGATSPGIDNWGHLGGLIAGSIFAALAGPRWQVLGSYPNLQLSDQRRRGEVVLAGVVTAAAFVIIAAVTIHTRAQ